MAFVVAVPLAGSDIGSVTTAVLFGRGYGLVLFAGAAVFRMRVVSGMGPERPRVALFLLFHLADGGVLDRWSQVTPV